MRKRKFNLHSHVYEKWFFSHMIFSIVDFFLYKMRLQREWKANFFSRFFAPITMLRSYFLTFSAWKKTRWYKTVVQFLTRPLMPIYPFTSCPEQSLWMARKRSQGRIIQVSGCVVFKCGRVIILRDEWFFSTCNGFYYLSWTSVCFSSICSEHLCGLADECYTSKKIKLLLRY